MLISLERVVHTQIGYDAPGIDLTEMSLIHEAESTV